MWKLNSLASRLLAVAMFTVVLSCQDDDPVDTPNARDNYLGVWECTEKTGINAPQIYTLNIVEGSQDDEIVFMGLYNINGTQVTARVDGLNFVISSQLSEGFTFSGSGSINASSDQINLDFETDDGATVDQIEAVMTK